MNETAITQRSIKDSAPGEAVTAPPVDRIRSLITEWRVRASRLEAHLIAAYGAEYIRAAARLTVLREGADDLEALLDEIAGAS